MQPIYFSSPAEFREWLEKNHARESELLVGYHKKGSGVPSMTWPESVDEALCFGWIDGIRRGVDEHRYTIRFTPRKARSNWSAVNIKRVAELKELGRMKPAGLKAFEERVAKRDYAYETRPQELAPEYAKRFPRKAWAFFEAQPPYYRRVISFWVMSARKEETRRSRLEKLIAACVESKRLR